MYLINAAYLGEKTSALRLQVQKYKNKGDLHFEHRERSRATRIVSSSSERHIINLDYVLAMGDR